MSGLKLDFFAGGGGASTGIEEALGEPVDYAINHDPQAIVMHRVNHPRTRHLMTSVWDVNARKLAAGRRVDMAWFSPDCTFFSAARGGKPFRDRDPARRRRGLAWIVPYWAKTVRPRVILLENVLELKDWGPLTPEGKIDPVRRGITFRRWHRQIENLGYRIDMRELRACDYGAPTTRKRLFVIARCDGQEIVFPDATHGPFSYQKPYRTAAECIDWSIPCPSIFTRKRPLVEATLRRIARGIERFVEGDPNPFIIHTTHHGARRVHPISEPRPTITAAQRGELALIAPVIINTRNGERHGIHGEQAPRVRDIREPYPTITAQGSQGALVAAFLAKHYGGHEGSGASLQKPLSTITTVDHHALVKAFLIRYNGRSVGQSLHDPISTIDTRDRFGLVTIHGQDYRIDDIGMRHLVDRELYLAQSFPAEYVIDHGINEDGASVPLTKTDRIRMCGNSVPPIVAKALVTANVIDQREERAA